MTRELENTVRELCKAVIDLQHRVKNLDDGDLRWPADSHEPPYDLARRASRDR